MSATTPYARARFAASAISATPTVNLSGVVALLREHRANLLAEARALPPEMERLRAEAKAAPLEATALYALIMEGRSRVSDIRHMVAQIDIALVRLGENLTWLTP